MSGEKNDLSVNSTLTGGKKSFKRCGLVTSKLDVEMEPEEIKLSEEESSDEDLRLDHESADEDLMSNNKKKATAEELDQIKVDPCIPASNVQATSYDFSGILKLHTDLVQARERFDNCIANIVDKDGQKPNNANIQPSLDNYSVEELLQLGETPVLDVEDQSSSSSNSDEACTQSVEITLPSQFEDKELRRQKNKELALTKHLNQVRNERQKELHKVHLLCLIAHGNYINNIINNDLLYGRALSFLPMDYFPPQLVTASYILRLLKWFGKKFLPNKHKKAGRLSVTKLEEVLTNSKPCSVRDSVILFVSLLRGLGLTARFVINFTPLPLKANKIRWSLKQSENLDVKSKQGKKNRLLCKPGYSQEELGPLLSESISPAPGPSTDRSTLGAIPKYCSPKAGPSSKNGKVVPKIGKSASITLNDSVSLKPLASKSSRSRLSAKLDKTPAVKSKLKSQKTEVKRKSAELDTAQEGSCALVGSISKRKPNTSAGSSHLNSRSSDDEEAVTNVKCGIDYWAEVFIENEDHWISVDLFSFKVDCVREIANRCTQPIAYILGWKNDGSVKDVTLRYAANWVTKKYRVENEWWAKSLHPFLSKNYELDIMEEDQLKEIIEKAPMPTSISELKNHPMYVLPRHLLKYEAIYPKDSVPLGFVKGEPVYSRYCVNVLCSREKWLQQAKSIKLGQLPYKTVKSRTKTDKFASKNLDSGYKPLELFGSWQVDDYIPPIAVDGKVPKNKYGNVELYKPSMLPSGTVHIQVPGLMKIAQKLQIDCAPAVIGWQHHNGMSHPVIDGVVVCKEYQDVLLDAWNSEVDQNEFHYTVKRKIRAKKNWLKICKSLLIKERLKQKYNFGQEEPAVGESLPKLPKK